VDKAAGPTSHDVVQRVRRAYGTRAAGHTGTLDPFATGLLVVLVGRATRLARFVEARPKRYLATARLGVATETDDATGAVTATADPVSVAALDEHRVRQALLALRGEGRQRPPAYSAKKVQGERSYALARRGEAVALAEVPVTVHDVELVAWRNPELRFRVTVSAGTYVRALARDLGLALGVGAHLTALRREAIGPLRVEDAAPLEALEGPETRPPLLPPLAVLPDMPRAALDEAGALDVGHGRPVPLPAELADSADDLDVALVHGGRLVAVAGRRGGSLQPDVVLEPA
jgi:tRNA pseudouridine55 synthase